MKKKIGFYGGTFDPIHHGHLHIALEALEKGGLDEILFCPAATSPFKMDKGPAASGSDRLEMVKLAIEGIKGLSCTDQEIKRAGPSYTIDTVEALKQEHPLHSYYLLLADDQLAGFSRWKDPDKLSSLAPLKIGSRLYRSYNELKASSRWPVEESQCFFGPLLEISSTLLRERIKKRLYCRHLAPSKVIDYIEHHGLYLTD